MTRGALLALWLLPVPALAFGGSGHRFLASVMQDPLPADHCLRLWFAAQQTPALQDHASDPDRWRVTSNPNYDPQEAPRHFLQIDAVNPPSNYPRDYAQVEALLGAAGAVENGIVPWHAEVVWWQLVAAFGVQNTAQILDRAFVFSHYVTDPFSPFHTTVNFDPGGSHSRYEGDMLADPAHLTESQQLARAMFGTPGRADPRNALFDIMLIGNTLVPTLVAADVAATGPPTSAVCTSDFVCDAGSFCVGSSCRDYDLEGYYQALKDLNARRWGDAATLLASLLWSAWAQAGAPALAGFPAGCSMALPEGDPVLVGYPTVFTHVDAGAPDAGTPDAGEDAPPDGSGGGGGHTGTCSCSSSPALWVFALLAAASGLRRRR